MRARAHSGHRSRGERQQLSTKAHAPSPSRIARRRRLEHHHATNEVLLHQRAFSEQRTTSANDASSRVNDRSSGLTHSMQ
jgi:hypothetical protein